MLCMGPKQDCDFSGSPTRKVNPITYKCDNGIGKKKSLSLDSKEVPHVGLHLCVTGEVDNASQKQFQIMVVQVLTKPQSHGVEADTDFNHMESGPGLGLSLLPAVGFGCPAVSTSIKWQF